MGGWVHHWIGGGGRGKIKSKKASSKITDIVGYDLKMYVMCVCCLF